MAASYPTSVKSWTPVADTVDDVLDHHVNEAYDEIIAIETELLGTKSDLADNLTTMGVTAADTESFTDLVAKVLDVPLVPSICKGALFGKKLANSAELETNVWLDELNAVNKIASSSVDYVFHGNRLLSTYPSTTRYEADALPNNATPAWTRTLSGSATTESVSGGILTLKVPHASSLSYAVGTGTLVPANKKIINFRAKVLEGNGFGITFADGVKHVLVYFKLDGSISCYAPTNQTISTGNVFTSWFNGRLEFDNSSGLTIYINNSSVATVTYANIYADAVTNGIIMYCNGNADAVVPSHQIDFFLFNLNASGTPSATVYWTAVTSTGTLTMATVSAYETLGAGSITYYISRDAGTHYTECTPNETTDISAQDNDTDVMLKAIISGNSELHAVSYGGTT